MAEISGANMCFVAILSVTALAFTAYHTYKFDKWRCLVPRRKEWFRVVLTWILVLSNLGMLVWGAGWSYVRYNLGWVTLPGYGARPYPTELFDAHWMPYNTPLTAFLSLAFCAQVSLNAEEGLYWYHLMRAVRRPQAAKSWLTSSFFFAWIIISVSALIAEFGAGWIGYVDDDTQMARMFVCGGAIELVVVGAASTVLLTFPNFLEDVKRSGAGPEVRSRLHYYHEANKVRTLFRSLFTMSILTLGIDGLTMAKVVNQNHLAADLLIQVATGSYFFASVISVQLYLPRAYNKETTQPRVMVGAQPQQYHAQHGASNVQLMSLLREGGQWDEDNDLRAGMARTRTESKAFEDVEWGKEGFQEEQPGIPALENFTSPFAVRINEPRPTDIRIHVQQEVHDDSDKDKHPYASVAK